ncbi:HIT family hydrolase [Helicobacter monodelphidis]|uniref:HIT family protein n=1 Tax=Helicobacter sp. 15-1451 TaxID=2004995 RepID=UPI000DCCCC3B|nr:HIT domain-containing protein [Helicobacter sp. 15-1451]RAX57674.1 HIT family hydrolase [Helicobacter sp. 15-1451]
MDNIYAPWRSVYLSEKIEGCVFCHISQQTQNDGVHQVFYRDAICFGVMNKYPYTPGHFMLIPHRHIDCPAAMSLEQWLHIQTLAQRGITMLLEGMGAQGVNMGINVRKSAGAGIPDHLHLHFVPRWHGDTNFMTTIADTRVYSTDFNALYQRFVEMAKEYLVSELPHYHE